jgi:hypothetical protein
MTSQARAIQEIVPLKQTVINPKLLGEVKKFLRENNHGSKLNSWTDEDIWVVLTEKAEPRNEALAAAFYIIECTDRSVFTIFRGNVDFSKCHHGPHLLHSAVWCCWLAVY